MEKDNLSKNQLYDKLISRGAGYLSDQELIALILGRDSKSANMLAQKVLELMDKSNGQLTLMDLDAIQGLSGNRAALLLAVVELGRRWMGAQGVKIKFPGDVLPLLMHYANRKQEHFLCVSLNGAGEVLAVRVVCVGGGNTAIVHPREVFADPITDRAQGIIVAHNHPSNNLEPTPEDIDLTEKLQIAGEILGIKLFDHIIFNPKNRYYSFLDNKMI